MGTDQLLRLPEQPTQPPHLPDHLDRGAEFTYKQAYTDAMLQARAQITRILVTGQGQFETVNATGLGVTYDAGDLWDVITENEESADLHMLAGGFLGDPVTFQHAASFVRQKIHELVEAHANEMALKAEREYLSERRVF